MYHYELIAIFTELYGTNTQYNSSTYKARC